MTESNQKSDEKYLRQTLHLAKKASGRTYPNPMVGAVIVKNGKVLGTGYHHRAGRAHAEIKALKSLKVSAKDATLYVNLEPCAHHGKTPPCVEAIIGSGVKRVVCCSLDPNPLVSGQGLALLRRAGIRVSVGTLKAEAEMLNEVYFGFHTWHRPFIAIKFASSLDGKISTNSGDSKWITNEKARNQARKLRSQYQAVLVGANTVVQDDPNLGIRSRTKTDPLRIILDSTLRIPTDAQVFRDSNVLVVTTKRAIRTKLKSLENKGIEVFICSGDQIKLPALMKELRRRNIIGVFVEGGGEVLGSFVDAGLVDKVYAFYGPLLIGGNKATGAIAGEGAEKIYKALHLTLLSYRKLDDSFLISGYPAKH